MVKKKKAAKKTMSRPKGSGKSNGIAVGQLLQIETSPPPYRRSFRPEVEELRKKVDATIPHVKPGQAFIIPKKGSESIKKHLKTLHPERRYTFAKVLTNPDVVRVYYIDSEKK